MKRYGGEIDTSSDICEVMMKEISATVDGESSIAGWRQSML